MIEYHNIQAEKQTQDLKCQEIETKIADEQQKYARLSVKVDKLMQRKYALSMAEE